jgi:hypothetical protein
LVFGVSKIRQAENTNNQPERITLLRIRTITPAYHQGDGRFRAVARFDVEVTPSLTLFNWTLRAAPDGGHIVLPPNALGKRVAGFSREFAAEVTQAALAAFKELSPNDRRAA